MIIVEGPDNSGKTTLAKKLCDRFDLVYTRPPSDLLSSTEGPGEGLLEWWENELRRPREHRKKLVYDRTFFISDPIYRSAVPIPGRELPASRMAEGLAAIIDYYHVIFCLPPWQLQKEALEKEMAEGGGYKGLTLEHAEAINYAYTAWFILAKDANWGQVHLYNYTREAEWEHLERALMRDYDRR